MRGELRQEEAWERFASHQCLVAAGLPGWQGETTDATVGRPGRTFWDECVRVPEPKAGQPRWFVRVFTSPGDVAKFRHRFKGRVLRVQTPNGDFVTPEAVEIKVL